MTKKPKFSISYHSEKQREKREERYILIENISDGELTCFGCVSACVTTSSGPVVLSAFSARAFFFLPLFFLLFRLLLVLFLCCVGFSFCVSGSCMIHDHTTYPIRL